MQVYLGTLLIAFAMLAMEITFTRLLSVTTWYHLAFFAIATAMLGMTAGATTIYLKPRRFTKERLNEELAAACQRFALVVPVALVVLCLTPLSIAPTIMSIIAMLIVTAGCALPYYFAGIAITLILTKCDKPIGKLYAADLAGASLGCLFVLAGLEVMDAPSLILLCGALGAAAGLVFAWQQTSAARTRWVAVTTVLLAVVALGNTLSPRMIRPLVIKGLVYPSTRNFLDKWNSFSRISVSPLAHEPPFYWAASPKAPTAPVYEYAMQIDGGAGTFLRRFHSIEDIDHLRYDVTNIAYSIRPRGGACIIGVGGGRDLQAALLFGHEHVTGIDVNPIFINLLENEFRDFAGLADRDDVTLVVDEARSYLSRDTQQYSLLQMSLIDTFAATGAGAFSLSENSLYTVEAWDVFLNRLTDDGVFTVSRWYCPDNLGETGRLLSLAIAAVLRTGAEDPSQHIALVTCGRVATLVLSRSPLKPEEIATLTSASAEMEFSVPIMPGRVPEHAVLRELLTARSVDDLTRIAADKPLRFDPPTDEDPYFFNMLKFDRFSSLGRFGAGVIGGNLVATVTLVALIFSLLILAVATILVPLLLARRMDDGPKSGGKVIWAGAAYFALIGAGFMLMEIALVQRLSVLLSHPVYALGILLFTMILSTGVGSLLSERLPLTRAPWVSLYPLAAVGAILSVRVVLSMLLANMITSAMLTKILVSIAVIFPLGIIMGLFFPTGMRLVRAIRDEETPWYWALNGVFGVLASALAVFFSIFFGVSTNFYVAAGCYGLVLLCAVALHQKGQKTRNEAMADTSCDEFRGAGAGEIQRVDAPHEDGIAGPVDTTVAQPAQ